MESLTKISVIIPVYNAEKTIKECLDSVLSQGIDSLEIVCVDDGSEDKSAEIIKEYTSNDSRISLLTQKNQYAGVARNRGLENAKGEYVAFLDADDFFLPGALLRMLKIAKRHNLDLLKTGFTFLNTVTKKRYKTLFSTNSAIGFVDKMRVLTLKDKPIRLLNSADVPWNGIYRRSFLLENGIRFNSLQCVNDHSFYVHCLLKAQRMKFKSFSSVCYRVGQSDSLIGKKASKFENQIISFDIVKKLVAGEDERIKNAVMERELYLVFDWYTTLSTSNEAHAVLTRKIQNFISEFDESDVSSDFTKTFAYSDVYHNLRYGTPSPVKPGKIQKAFNCYREHGLRYTLNRLFKRERKYKE